MAMSGKTKPPYQTPDSKLELERYAEMTRQIGLKYSMLPNQETLLLSQKTFKNVLITSCREYAWTTRAHLQSSEPPFYSMAQLALAKVDEPGKKRAYMLTLKIPVPNGGVATRVCGLLNEVKNM